MKSRDWRPRGLSRLSPSKRTPTDRVGQLPLPSSFARHCKQEAWNLAIAVHAFAGNALEDIVPSLRYRYVLTMPTYLKEKWNVFLSNLDQPTAPAVRDRRSDVSRLRGCRGRLCTAPTTTNIGYSPKQPVPFSHKLHAGTLNIDCRYCHNTVTKAAHAAVHLPRRASTATVLPTPTAASRPPPSTQRVRSCSRFARARPRASPSNGSEFTTWRTMCTSIIAPT